MMKRTLLILAAFLTLCASASAYDGGIKASVVNRTGRAPVAGALVSLIQDG